METPVAQAVGPVEAAIVNHQGHRDSQNAFFVASLRPLVSTIAVWSADHPGRRRSRRAMDGESGCGPVYVGIRAASAATHLVANFLFLRQDPTDLRPCGRSLASLSGRIPVGQAEQRVTRPCTPVWHYLPQFVPLDIDSRANASF